MDWTRDEVEILFRLSGSFEHFLEMNGLDSEHPFVSQIETPSQSLVVKEEDRPFLIAWVVWQLSFKHDQTIVWMKRPWYPNSPILEVAPMIEQMGKMAPKIIERNKRVLSLDTGMRLITCAMTPHAAKGMTFSHWIIEGGEPGSPLWDEIMRAYLPVMRFSANARLIILEKTC